MLYLQIALALQELSEAARSEKAALIARMVSELKPELLCPAVRLLLGQLWPPWEVREMGVGPEGLSAALEEISEGDIPELREITGEMGLVAEAALAKKGQHSLAVEPLQAMSVYEQLNRISQIRGKDSEQRKNAFLRGLFQVADPLEGKYIARTVLGNMLAGIGPKTMLSAFVLAFHTDKDQLQRAYGLLPDPGSIAVMAARGQLENARILPGIPLKPMMICSERALDHKTEEATEGMAVFPKYPALGVQVHKTGAGAFIFSSRLRNITTALNGLAQRLGGIDEEFIIDADLIGFKDGKICSQSDMIRHINRRRLSRRSSISPALLAYDLLYLSGTDIVGLSFLERRTRLQEALGEPRSMPFQGLSIVPQLFIKEMDSLSGHLDRLKEEGGEGLMVRSLEAVYHPGVCSSSDFFIEAGAYISAVIIRAEYGRKRENQIFSRFHIALRNGDDLVPVGWIGGQLGQKDIIALDRQLKALAREWDEWGAAVIPQVVVHLRTGKVRRSEKGYTIIRPQIEQIDLSASWEDADELDRLLAVCCQ